MSGPLNPYPLGDGNWFRLFSGFDFGAPVYRQSTKLGSAIGGKFGLNLFESHFFVNKWEFVEMKQAFDPPLNLLVSPFELNVNIPGDDVGEKRAPVAFRHRLGCGLNTGLLLLTSLNAYGFIDHTPDFQHMEAVGAGIDFATATVWAIPGIYAEVGRDFVTDGAYVMIGVRWSHLYGPMPLIYDAIKGKD